MTHHCLVFVVLFFLLACSDSKRNETKHDDGKKAEALIKKLEPLDVPLEQPKPGDWLFVHDEKGQTFEQYKASNPLKPDSIHNTIYIQPIGEFSVLQDSIMNKVADYLTLFFSVRTIRLATVSYSVIPEKHVRKFSDGSEQLLTTDILNYLHNVMLEDGLVTMAITSKDLYAGANYNFVFGQARAKHRVAVSSLFRYYQDPLDSLGSHIVLQRLIKTSAHEIGHMFGCQHCTNAVCLMNGSNSLGESDSRPNRLCSECLHKLQWNLNLDVCSRQKALQEFFQLNNLKNDYGPGRRDLKALGENPAGLLK
jgi:archaemetzincin